MIPSEPDAVAIYGAGKEAEAALGYLAELEKPPRVVLLDDSPERARTLASRHPIAEAAERLDDLARADLLLRAPSVRPEHAAQAWAKANGAPCTTFTGWWLSRHRDRVAATVTGTKGKSTTTVLLAKLLTEAGRPTRAAGNLGVPPRIEDLGPRESVVLEMSSYQLHDAPAAAPVHLVTNLFHEHLDWHGGAEPYWRAKFSPLEIDPACVGVLRARDVKLLGEGMPNRIERIGDVALVDEDGMVLSLGGRRVEQRFPVGVAPAGVRRMNFAAALAAAAVTEKASLEALADAAVRVASAFPDLPSRQHVIGTFAGRIWIDDALATIPEATLAALERWKDAPVRLIVGGKDRGVDLSTLAEGLRARADVTVHGYAETGERLAQLLARPEVYAVRSLESAIADAFAASAPGDVILFSPAAATPEPGWSYEQRSQAFRRMAEELAKGGK
jgi:UDP-N-acetylmuramoylalanine--D-glutamate ligase